MQRREFLRLSGAAGLAGVGGWAWYDAEGGQLRASDDPAYRAWGDWNVDGESRPLSLVRAAVLASSPHNTQPWRFRVGDDFVELYLDARRSVAGLDPYLREAYIGAGCGLENLLLSAQVHGLAATVTVPGGTLGAAGPGMRLVARVELMPCEARPSELHEAIPNRHTNRSVYDRSKQLPDGFAKELAEVCDAGEDARLFVVEDRRVQEALTRISLAANVTVVLGREGGGGKRAVDPLAPG